MLEEFKPNKEVFNIIQNDKPKKIKGNSKLKLWACNCGVKLRVGKENINVMCFFKKIFVI